MADVEKSNPPNAERGIVPPINKLAGRRSIVLITGFASGNTARWPPGGGAGAGGARRARVADHAKAVELRMTGSACRPRRVPVVARSPRWCRLDQPDQLFPSRQALEGGRPLLGRRRRWHGQGGCAGWASSPPLLRALDHIRRDSPRARGASVSRSSVSSARRPYSKMVGRSRPARAVRVSPSVDAVITCACAPATRFGVGDRRQVEPDRPVAPPPMALPMLAAPRCRPHGPCRGAVHRLGNVLGGEGSTGASMRCDAL